MTLQEIPTEDLLTAQGLFAVYPEAVKYQFFRHICLGEKALAMTEEESREASVEIVEFDKHAVLEELKSRKTSDSASQR